MNLRPLFVLISLFVSIPSFATQATTDQLLAIIQNISHSVNEIRNDYGETADKITLEREHFNQIYSSLKEFTVFTDFKNVKSRSGKEINDLAAIMHKLNEAVAYYQEIVSDFDEVIAILSMNPEIQSIPEDDSEQNSEQNSKQSLVIKSLAIKALLHCFELTPFAEKNENRNYLNLVHTLMTKLEE